MEMGGGQEKRGDRWFIHLKHPGNKVQLEVLPDEAGERESDHEEHCIMHMTQVRWEQFACLSPMLLFGRRAGGRRLDQDREGEGGRGREREGEGKILWHRIRKPGGEGWGRRAFSSWRSAR
jgi:hypothetical protein